jgi:hypothetical protein
MSRGEEINFVNHVLKLSLNIIGRADRKKMDTAEVHIYHFMHRSYLRNSICIVTPVHLVKATGFMVDPSDHTV